MKKAIYLSIKPKFTQKIETGEKNYEFRKYIPKNEINMLYVYETVPNCCLKYVIELGTIIEYPNKILKAGYGNEDFNNGLKQSKYAYEIKKLYKLERPIKLIELKEKYGFAPPQSYAYDDRYPELTEEIKIAKKTRII